jgi:hypothetical protein
LAQRLGNRNCVAAAPLSATEYPILFDLGIELRAEPSHWATGYIDNIAIKAFDARTLSRLGTRHDAFEIADEIADNWRLRFGPLQGGKAIGWAAACISSA